MVLPLLTRSPILNACRRYMAHAGHCTVAALTSSGRGRRYAGAWSRHDARMLFTLHWARTRAHFDGASVSQRSCASLALASSLVCSCRKRSSALADSASFRWSISACSEYSFSTTGVIRTLNTTNSNCHIQHELIDAIQCFREVHGGFSSFLET